MTQKLAWLMVVVFMGSAVLAFGALGAVSGGGSAAEAMVLPPADVPGGFVSVGGRAEVSRNWVGAYARGYRRSGSGEVVLPGVAAFIAAVVVYASPELAAAALSDLAASVARARVAHSTVSVPADSGLGSDVALYRLVRSSGGVRWELDTLVWTDGAVEGVIAAQGPSATITVRAMVALGRRQGARISRFILAV